MCAQRRIQDAQHERAQVAWAVGPHALAPGSVTSLLRLHPVVGNGGTVITRSGLAAPTAAPGISLPSPPGPVVSPDERAFDDAVNSGDWTAAAMSLAKLAMPAMKLSPLAIEQLRLLQDAVARARFVLGGIGRVLQMAIAVALQAKGVPPTKVAAGTAFGTLVTTVG
ncbi:MAG: hypothetical protein ACRDSH_01905, partial [Pseudonocardiaceae bacterium]